MSVYLDYNATTPIDPRVGAAMARWLAEGFGNPSSHDHRWGWDAAEAVEAARGVVADVVGARPADVVFTSGATEAVNAVIRSYVGFEGWDHKRIIVGATEHDAVLAPSRHLCERTGIALEVLTVDALGHVDPGALSAAVSRAPNALVALMAANNEIGTLHPVREIARLVHANGGRLLCDATQALGKAPLAHWAGVADYVTVSAHKAYGPKGAGALVTCTPAPDGAADWLILGGGQERGARGGTLNVPAVVGLGEACRLAAEGLDDEEPRLRALRDLLEAGILAQVPDAWVNGDRSSRLCNTSNVGLRGVDARTLIRDMDDVGASTRAACSSGGAGPSRVLKAIGLSDADAYTCVRFSLGRFTTADEVDYAVGKVVRSAHRLRRQAGARA